VGTITKILSAMPDKVQFQTSCGHIQTVVWSEQELQDVMKLPVIYQVELGGDYLCRCECGDGCACQFKSGEVSER
jgi:hypothetical protein